VPQQPRRRLFLSEAALFALSSCALGGPKRRAVPKSEEVIGGTQQSEGRALVVGVVAVGVNGLLYFAYYLPRMTPLIEQIQSIDKPLSEVISEPEVISKALPEALMDGSPPESPMPPQRQTSPPPQQQSSPTASPTPPPQ
jgi:hypothetical protein